MIVLCPTCHTRYRHDPDPGEERTTAECSRCEETIPLVAARRSYVLLPPDPAAAERGGFVPAGMDDPTLADRLARARSNVPCPAPAGEDPTPLFDEAPEPGVETAEATPGWWRTEGRDLGIALAPSAVCALVGYYLAGQQNQDPITWSALGGAVGLLMGWVCLLWMHRNR